MNAKLTLTDTLIQHIDFSHATLGTALKIHVPSTISFNENSKVGEIFSNGTGSHVAILTSTELESSSISSLASQFLSWGPTLKNSNRFSKDEINEFVLIDEKSKVEELIYRWHPYDNETLFVDRTGGSHLKCGLSVLPCSSLSSNVRKVGTGEAIKVCSTLTETTGFVATKDLSITSSENTKQIMSVSSSTTFTTQDSNLTFTDLSFIPLPSNPSQNTEPSQRTDSLFVVESGSIELTTYSVSSFVLANKPLLTLTSGSLTLESCDISSITRSTGNGTVLEIAMDRVLFLSLNDVTFSSMPSSKESALLALSFPPFDESGPMPLFDFNLTNLHFVEMVENGNDESCFVSVVGSRLADWISENDTRFAGSYTNKSPLNNFLSFNETHALPASLLFYLLPSEGPVGVSCSGIDMAKCGSNSIWCPTISQSLDRLAAQKTNKIVVMDEIDLSTTISLPNDVIFSGNDAKTLCACVVGESGSFEASGDDVVSITTLDFSLPLSQSVDAVIVHSSDKLTLSRLHISSKGKSSAVFLRMTTGTTEMSNIVVHSEMEKNSVLFSLLEGSVNITTLAIETSVAQNGSVVKMEGGNLSLTGMTLSSSEPIEGQLLSLANSPFTLSNIKITNHTFLCPLFTFSDFGESSINNMNVSGSRALIHLGCQPRGAVDDDDEEDEGKHAMKKQFDTTCTIEFIGVPVDESEPQSFNSQCASSIERGADTTERSGIEGEEVLACTVVVFVGEIPWIAKQLSGDVDEKEMRGELEEVVPIHSPPKTSGTPSLIHMQFIITPFRESRPLRAHTDPITAF
ncbi:hypothetical protein BLNAU_6146 [Blattamonas nauphoetae]|uniref:Uncharacterized protein n=1 Tax=Blattamonas nauphoetae TaxID=2049346 RepID=A0ABQ9Y577_9EUKA|nr:hypothetical protein BLNAU_6146 [Blattamonas nauphoetae]